MSAVPPSGGAESLSAVPPSGGAKSLSVVPPLGGAVVPPKGGLPENAADNDETKKNGD